MRFKKPYVASLDQITIKREGDYAIIEYKEPGVRSVYLEIGPTISDMTDREILDVHNDVLLSQQEMAGRYQYFAVEVPVGRPQIEYFGEGNQWVPRGDVLRCLISDGGPDGEVTIYVDDRELSLTEFGRLLSAFAGWGMRITFVPEDAIHKDPLTIIQDPPGLAGAGE